MAERLIGFKKIQEAVWRHPRRQESELLDYGAIKKSCTPRDTRCRVHYRDSMKSSQKGSCEKNRVEPHKAIPKGSSFAKLTPAKLSVSCSRVNSHERPQFGGTSPCSCPQVVSFELLNGISIGLAPAEEAVMKPGLIKLYKTEEEETRRGNGQNAIENRIPRQNEEQPRRLRRAFNLGIMKRGSTWAGASPYPARKRETPHIDSNTRCAIEATRKGSGSTTKCISPRHLHKYVHLRLEHPSLCLRKASMRN